MWVDSEYTSELAVLSAWVSVLLPWNVTYFSRETGTFVPEEVLATFGLSGSETVTMFVLRFPFFELQFREETLVVDGIGVEIGDSLTAEYPGTALAGEVYLTTPPTAAAFYDGLLGQAALLWTVAAIAFALALGLSLALWLRTEWTVARLPASEVRLMGALLAVAALAVTGASVLQYVARDVAGTPVPAGAVVVGALAAVLLVTSERDSG